jgi:hypothetical protein
MKENIEKAGEFAKINSDKKPDFSAKARFFIIVGILSIQF